MIKLEKIRKSGEDNEVKYCYRMAVIVDENGNACIIDVAKRDWRDAVDCSTMLLKEIEVPIKKQK